MHPNSATNTKTSSNTVPALDFLSFRLKLKSTPGYVKVSDTSAKFYSTASTLSSRVSIRKHAQRAAVLPTLSVRLSVTLWYYSKWMCRLSLFWGVLPWFFRVPTCYKIPTGIPSAGALSALGCKEFATFDRNCRSPRKWTNGMKQVQSIMDH